MIKFFMIITISQKILSIEKNIKLYIEYIMFIEI